MAAHAKYSASSADRWCHCPASVALIAEAPEPPPSPYAEEGTKAHECLEAFLTNGEDAQDSTLLELQLDSNYNAEMIGHAHYAAIIIWEKLSQSSKNAKLLCETKFKLDFIHPDFGGTADAVIVDPYGKLVVYDLKYGAGVPVNVQHNKQMITYSLGAAHANDYEFTEVEMVIIQPRAEHSDGPVRSHTMTIDELLEYREVFTKAIEQCEDPMAPFNASPKACRFCPAKSICPEISNRAMAQAKIDFTPIGEGQVLAPVLKVPESLPIPELPKIMKAIPSIEEWIKGVKELAFNTLNAGIKIEGVKLVEKKGVRKWTDTVLTTAEAEKEFGEAAFTEPELKSPAQLEKISKHAKEFVKTRAIQISSGLTMVYESEDDRPAINPAKSRKDDFEVIDKPIAESDWKNKTVSKKTKGKTNVKRK